MLWKLCPCLFTQTKIFKLAVPFKNNNNKKLVTIDREKTKSPKAPSKPKEKQISKAQERPVSKTQARPMSKTQTRPISKTQALKKTEKDERNKNIRQCSISTFEFI